MTMKNALIAPVLLGPRGPSRLLKCVELGGFEPP
jgi:hypothetical protein